MVLKEDSKMLDEVVVVGYGTQKAKDVTVVLLVCYQFFQPMEKYFPNSFLTSKHIRQPAIE